MTSDTVNSRRMGARGRREVTLGGVAKVNKIDPESSAVPAEPLALTVDAADGAGLLGIGRTKFLQLHSSGRLPLPLRFGRAVRWRRQELVDWLNAGCPTRDKWKWKAQF